MNEGLAFAIHDRWVPSFKNKLINGGFDIWQRGVTSTGNGYYATDRCKQPSDKITLNYVLWNSGCKVSLNIVNIGG